jgi:4a-hydroxytetrahydrobiopterin dehydratase
MRFLPEWSRKGSVITRTYEFRDFGTAMVFVTAVAKLADRANHHPDIDIRYTKVTMSLSTHDAGGITQSDLTLAQRLDDALA